MPIVQIEDVMQPGQLGGLPPLKVLARKPVPFVTPAPFRSTPFQPRPKPVQDTPAQNHPPVTSFANRPKPTGPVDTLTPPGTGVRYPVSLPPWRPLPAPAKNHPPVTSFVNRPKPTGPVDTFTPPGTGVRFPVSLPPFRRITFQPLPKPVQDHPAPAPAPAAPMLPAPHILSPSFDSGFSSRPLDLFSPRAGGATTRILNDTGAQRPLDLFMTSPAVNQPPVTPFVNLPRPTGPVDTFKPPAGVRYPVSLPPWRPISFQPLPQPVQGTPAPAPAPAAPVLASAALAPVLAQLQALQGEMGTLLAQVAALKAAAPAPVAVQTVAAPVVGAPAQAPAPAPAVVGAPAPSAPSAALASMFAAPTGSSLYANVGAPTASSLFARPQESGSLFATVSRPGALSGLSDAVDTGKTWMALLGIGALIAMVAGTMNNRYAYKLSQQRKKDEE